MKKCEGARVIVIMSYIGTVSAYAKDLLTPTYLIS